MTERGITDRLMETLQASFRGSVLIKHNDRSTRFIPDVQMCYLDASTWLELKHLKRGEKLGDKQDRKRLMGQLVFGHQLATTCGGRCWFVVYDDEPRRMTIWRPQVLASSLWPAMTGLPPIEPFVIPHIPSCGQSSSDPTRSQYNLNALMTSVGAVRVENWPHEVVAQLIRQKLSAREFYRAG